MEAFISILGFAALIAIAVLFSTKRSAISIRTTAGAFLMQLAFGALVLYVPQGRKALLWLSGAVNSVIAYGDAGVEFVFAGLVGETMTELFGGGGFVFALRVLPLIVFFSALISVLYYLGVMNFLIRVIGGGLRIVLGTSKTESMSAAANIFVGQTEAPLVVKPYLSTMTNSELFAIMCGGMASVAGSVLLGYAKMGISLPYLIAAAFMAAPGGLLFAKLLHPQTEPVADGMSMSETTYLDDSGKEPENIFDSAALGASVGIRLAVNIGAMLIAFISIFAMVNGILGWVGGWFGYGDATLQAIIGWTLRPLMFLIGIPWGETLISGEIIGQRIVLNEFVAFADLLSYMGPDSAVTLSPKAQIIMTFTVCGFANLSSIGMQIGALGGLAPNRRQDVARMGLRALLAGVLSNLMSACIAGLFVTLFGGGL